jgi:hypothetical protein
MFLNRVLDKTVSISTILQLGLVSGGTYNVPQITIFVPEGSLSGETSILISDLNYKDLTTEGNLLVTQLSPSGYTYEVFGNIIFENPLPTPTPTNTSTPTPTSTSNETPTPTPTNTETPTPTPSSTEIITPTPTPTLPSENILDAILTDDGSYISVGNNEYLKFVDP